MSFYNSFVHGVLSIDLIESNIMNEETRRKSQVPFHM